MRPSFRSSTTVGLLFAACAPLALAGAQTGNPFTRSGRYPWSPVTRPG